MSVAEELHKTIDELTEEQQQELLETARQFFDKTLPDNTEQVGEDVGLQEELLRRYQHLRAHPEQVVSARESNKRVREKYGWQ